MVLGSPHFFPCHQLADTGAVSATVSPFTRGVPLSLDVWHRPSPLALGGAEASVRGRVPGLYPMDWGCVQCSGRPLSSLYEALGFIPSFSHTPPKV